MVITTKRKNALEQKPCKVTISNLGDYRFQFDNIKTEPLHSDDDCFMWIGEVNTAWEGITEAYKKWTKSKNMN